MFGNFIINWSLISLYIAIWFLLIRYIFRGLPNGVIAVYFFTSILFLVYMFVFAAPTMISAITKTGRGAAMRAFLGALVGGVVFAAIVQKLFDLPMMDVMFLG